ncbi:hypothetical protein C1645_840682 [Glomus cerebriforme]|uniref:RING-type domain-containing protein n=1 Tax=Glomus cerebriforme TaxID=658196 RepID=A0A397SAU5_9GLOM|nr:hypothetical protein C1645_840682 [Glomus cerebriforme]
MINGVTKEMRNEIAFTTLSCGYTFHRDCILKKFLLTQPNVCPFPDCRKNIKIVIPIRELSVSTQSSTLSMVGRMSTQLQINPTEMILEETTPELDMDTDRVMK